MLIDLTQVEQTWIIIRRGNKCMRLISYTCFQDYGPQNFMGGKFELWVLMGRCNKSSAKFVMSLKGKQKK